MVDLVAASNSEKIIDQRAEIFVRPFEKSIIIGCTSLIVRKLGAK